MPKPGCGLESECGTEKNFRARILGTPLFQILDPPLISAACIQKFCQGGGGGGGGGRFGIWKQRGRGGEGGGKLYSIM